MIIRTGFPEFLESAAIGPTQESLRQHELCEVLEEFPREINLVYIWKDIATSTQPIIAIRNFVKNFLLDSSELTTEFLVHYIKKLKLLTPEDYKTIEEEINTVFNKITTRPSTTNTALSAAAAAASSSRVKNTLENQNTKTEVAKRKFNNTVPLADDSDFMKQISDIMQSCQGSCNYLQPVSDKLATISDFSRLNTFQNSIMYDDNLSNPPPTGIGLNIINKIPRALQETVTKAYANAKMVLDSAREALVDSKTLTKLKAYAKQGVSADTMGFAFTGATNGAVFQSGLKAYDGALSKVRSKMGDCFRVADYAARYNSFDPEMNNAVASQKQYNLSVKDAAARGKQTNRVISAQGVAVPVAQQVRITPQEAIAPVTNEEARDYDDDIM